MFSSSLFNLLVFAIEMKKILMKASVFTNSLLNLDLKDYKTKRNILKYYIYYILLIRIQSLTLIKPSEI